MIQKATTRSCFVCGKTFLPRSKRRRIAEDYCSPTCRSTGLKPLDFAFEGALLRLLRSRPLDTPVAAAEAAREAAPSSWREHHERAVWAARRLQALGEVEILEEGREGGATELMVRLIPGRLDEAG